MYCKIKPIKRTDFEDKMERLEEAAAKATPKISRTVEANLGYEKVVYLSHPYGGREGMANQTAVCQMILTKMYPDWLIINPVAAFGNLYDCTDYEQGLKMTMYLLSTLADEMIVCSDDYRESKGCMAEIEFCEQYDIPVMYTDYWKLIEDFDYSTNKEES